MKNLFLSFIFFCFSCTCFSSIVPDKEKMSKQFPYGFLFGTAIAGFQVDMGCPTIPPEICEDRNSDWYQFVTDSFFSKHQRLFIRGEPIKNSSGFYELFAEDLARAKSELGNNAIRISIEWSRIFPRSTFEVSGYRDLKNIASSEGLAFYHRVFAAAKKEGITPLVTLNHYTLPLWMHDAKSCHQNIKTCKAKGWLDDRIVTEITKFSRFVGEEYGNEVDLWATLNEPFNAVVFPSYLVATPDRSNPPALLLNIQAAKKATLNLIEAHAAMFDAVHEADIYDADADGQAASVGIVYVYFGVEPASSKPEDLLATKNMDYFLNRMFMRPFLFGEVDPDWDGHVISRPDLRGKLDYIGVNYYGTITVKKGWVPWIDYISPFLRVNPLRTRSKISYPKGIYNVVDALKPHGIPIIITESGVNAKKDDEMVKSWLVETLAYTRQALADGNNIRGYFYWSLMDNYEWNHGMDWRFGLYAIDPNDPLKKRKPRSAVSVYRRITKDGAIPMEYLDKIRP